MPKTFQAPMTQNIRVRTLQRTSANGTTMQELYTAPADGAVVKALLVTSTDTTLRLMQLWINADGVNDTLLGTVSIPASAGNLGSTAVTVDFFTGGTTANQLLAALPRDQSGKPVLPIEGSDILKISTTTGTAATMHVTAIIEEF